MSRTNPIADVLAGAEPAPDDPEFDPAEDPREAYERLQKTTGVIDAPSDLPVQCLGMHGGLYYYLDGLKQLRALKEGEHGRSHILSLFGKQEDWLLDRFGVFDKSGLATGKFRAEIVQNMLMRACAKAGILDAARQVRGVGAWLGGDGELVVHQGDRVWIDGRVMPPARYGEHVYPAFPPTPRPAPDEQNTDAGQELLSLLRTWNWSHELHAMLVLGWIGQGYVAGAVDWRTHMIGDGERGSGKSTLQKLLAGVFGSWLLATSDTTAAALYQLMGGRAQPVAIDEFEAGDNPARKAQVIQVLRQASSGGVVQRGGDNHVGRQFSAQFPAFLTAITPISLQPQDESRLVRVKLLELPEGARAPDLRPAKLAQLGSRLMRRMRDQWPRYASTLAAYRAGLAEYARFDNRMQDTYGVLLACADMLLYDRGADLAEIEEICTRVQAMVAPAQAEAIADQARCLNHLLTSTVDRGGGHKRTVSSWIRQTRHRNIDGNPDAHTREAVSALGTLGLRVVEQKDAVYLFVANSHPQLVRIFDGTPWPGAAGATGSWSPTLRRLPGCVIPPNSIKVGGSTQRGTLVPIDDAIAWDDDE